MKQPEKNTLSENSNSNFLKTLDDFEKPRQAFSVYQANVLSQSFGNLDALEFAILSYCMTFIKKQDKANLSYHFKRADIIRDLKMSDGGASYQYIAQIFETLHQKTNLIIPMEKSDDGRVIKGYQSTSLFKAMNYWDDNTIEVVYNDTIAPYIFNLKSFFYVIDFYDVIKLKNKKYALLLLSIYARYKYDTNRKVTVTASIDEWRLWLLGSKIMEDPKEKEKWHTGRFKANVLKYGLEQLKKILGFSYKISNIKTTGKIVGFEVEFYRPSASELKFGKDEVGSEGSNQVISDPEKDKEYLMLITEFAIEKDITIKAAAKELKDSGLIEYIPSKVQ